MYLYFHCFALKAQGLENRQSQTAVRSNAGEPRMSC
jgi:hypothetical protein